MFIKVYLNLYIYYSCRFVFGGENGKFKFGPPEGHSPAVDSMIPKEQLKLEQCFWFGDTHRNVISGPIEAEYTPYVPKPVDTSSVSTEEYIQFNTAKLSC